MTKLARAGELRSLPIDGVDYSFRSPGVYDLSKIRRRLTLEGIRRPSTEEYEIAAIAGVKAMAEAVGDQVEGERQAAIVEEFYRLMPAIDEDKIDEPDLEARTAIVAEKEQERKTRQVELAPEIFAIEANLDRHWPQWRELRADARYFDEVSRIDAVRLLLVSRRKASPPPSADPSPPPSPTRGEGDDRAVEYLDREVSGESAGFLTEAAYAGIEEGHLRRLSTFALSLLAPAETERKN